MRMLYSECQTVVEVEHNNRLSGCQKVNGAPHVPGVTPVEHHDDDGGYLTVYSGAS